MKKLKTVKFIEEIVAEVGKENLNMNFTVPEDIYSAVKIMPMTG